MTLIMENKMTTSNIVTKLRTFGNALFKLSDIKGDYHHEVINELVRMSNLIIVHKLQIKKALEHIYDNENGAAMETLEQLLKDEKYNEKEKCNTNN